MPATPAGAPPRPLTVLHLVQPTDGGVARVVTDLVRAQTAAGLRAVVLCPSTGPLERAAAAAGAEVRCWLARREPGANLPWETAFAARAIRRAAPDVVHLHSAKAGLAGRLALRGRLPTVFQPHAWSFQAVQGPSARLALAWERRAVRWADRVLCVSHGERAHGERAGLAARWSVIPNGIDLGHHPPAGGVDRRQARAALAAVHGLPQRAPLVVCVARLCRQKGQDLLLHAWPEVAARVPGARLALVGAGDVPPVAERTPGVLLAGHTDDPAPWYAAADLVVLPSRWEGMALAPLEAMAAGRPVVLADVGGARECLPPGHAADCLVRPEDPAALAEALSRLLADPARREVLAREARAHAAAAHDVRRTAAACALLYAEILAERGGRAGPGGALRRTGGRTGGSAGGRTGGTAGGSGGGDGAPGAAGPGGDADPGPARRAAVQPGHGGVPRARTVWGELRAQ